MFLEMRTESETAEKERDELKEKVEELETTPDKGDPEVSTLVVLTQYSVLAQCS